MKGDRVLFHRKPGEVELVSSDPNSQDPQTRWQMQEFGGGVLILELAVFGRAFIPAAQIAECEDLEFVGRATES
ncbi:MAG TPA: hypothetical protein VIH76_10870 [Candidatus Acidoferrales bacterium]